MPIDPATLMVLSALGAASQIGGGMLGAHAAEKEGRRNRAWQKKVHEDELGESQANRELSERQALMQVAAQAPMNTLNLMSGLQDFRGRRTKNDSYFETIRALAKG